MKCCDMRASMLKHRIQIERKTRTPDGGGGFTDTWRADPPAGLFAHLKSVSAYEKWAAVRDQPRQVIKAVIRYRDDGNGNPYYGAADRVTMQGRTYAVDGVQDVEFARKWLTLTLVEGAPS